PKALMRPPHLGSPRAILRTTRESWMLLNSDIGFWSVSERDFFAFRTRSRLVCLRPWRGSVDWKPSPRSKRIKKHFERLPNTPVLRRRRPYPTRRGFWYTRNLRNSVVQCISRG